MTARCARRGHAGKHEVRCQGPGGEVMPKRAETVKASLLAKASTCINPAKRNKPSAVPNTRTPHFYPPALLTACPLSSTTSDCTIAHTFVKQPRQGWQLHSVTFAAALSPYLQLERFHVKIAQDSSLPTLTFPTPYLWPARIHSRHHGANSTGPSHAW